MSNKREELGLFALLMGYLFPWSMPGVERIKFFSKYTPDQVKQIRQRNMEILQPHMETYLRRWKVIVFLVVVSVGVAHLLGLDAVGNALSHVLFISFLSLLAVWRLTRMLRESSTGN